MRRLGRGGGFLCRSFGRNCGGLGSGERSAVIVDQTLRLKLVKTTVGQLGLPANARCLDYGCGAGDFTRMLSAMGLNVLGYDPSSAVIDVAHGQGVARNARFTTRIEDLTALPRMTAIPVNLERVNAVVAEQMLPA